MMTDELFTADVLCVRDEHNRLEEQRRMLDQEMETVLQQRKAAEELAKVWKLIIFMLRHVVYWLPLTSYEFVINYTYSDNVCINVLTLHVYSFDSFGAVRYLNFNI